MFGASCMQLVTKYRRMVTGRMKQKSGKTGTLVFFQATEMLAINFTSLPS